MNVAVKRFFLDTNVLLYWIDPTDHAKHVVARSWVEAIWEARCGSVSWQVLNEFYSNATRKLGIPSRGARALVEEYGTWAPITFDLPLLRRAWYWTDRASVAYWDALVVAAAETAGCKYLLSEDFQAGRKFGDLTVVNPFLAGPEGFDFE
jgi:predicted nucleic acid-binding protein